MKVALVQMTSGDDPDANLASCEAFVRDAVANGAEFVLTPEVCNCIAPNKGALSKLLHYESDDPFLARMKSLAAELAVWLLIGSIAVKSEIHEGKFANRSILIDRNGKVVARYDKIHMFDVDISETESYRESKTYAAGHQAVLAQTDFAKIGMTICYDLRFPHLYRSLAQAGAQILTVPAAFAVPTGKVHWETLLRARAIETGAFVLAPAQTGTHYEKDGKLRQTYGHSMVVSPWGEVILDSDTSQGVFVVDLELSLVEKTRKRVGSISQVSEFETPK